MKLAMEDMPVRMRTARPLTDAELERLSESQEALLIEREPNGELDVRPIGGFQVSNVCGNLLLPLAEWHDKTKSGRVLLNVGCLLRDGSMRGPRLCWVSKAKWGEFDTSSEDGFLPFCPEFVVEVFSPVNFTLPEIRLRMEAWIRNGAELGWMIDPDSKVVEVYRPTQDREVCRGEASLDGQGVLSGFSLKLTEIWK